MRTLYVVKDSIWAIFIAFFPNFLNVDIRDANYESKIKRKKRRKGVKAMKTDIKKLVSQEGQGEINKKVGELKYSLNMWALSSTKLINTFSPVFNPLFFAKSIEAGVSANKVFKLEIEDVEFEELLAPKIEELIDTFYTDEQKKKLIAKLNEGLESD